MSKENIQKSILLLDEVNLELSELLKDEPTLSIRINSALIRLGNGLKVVVGDELSEKNETTEFKPLKKLLGRDIQPAERPTVEAPKEDKILEFREQMLVIKETFPEQDTKELLELLTDKEVRSIAKLSGIEVTVTSPEKITTSFIDKIKDAILAERQLLAEQEEETEKLNTGGAVLTDAKPAPKNAVQAKK